MATKLSKFGKQIEIMKLRLVRVHREDRYPEIEIRLINGQCIMRAQLDQIFDGDGNLFEDNLA